METPSCFEPKCKDCNYFPVCKNAATVLAYCEKAISPQAERVGEREFAKVHAKRKFKGGIKIKDMTSEELHAYWREQAVKKRKRLLDEKQDLTPKGKKVMADLQRNADTIKKIKEDFPDAISERP